MGKILLLILLTGCSSINKVYTNVITARRCVKFVEDCRYGKVYRVCDISPYVDLRPFRRQHPYSVKRKDGSVKTCNYQAGP